MSELQGAVTNLSAAAVRLPGITGAVADEAKDLPGLVRQTQISMRELERLIEAVQKNWLVRKHVNKTNPPPISPAIEETPQPEVKSTSHSSQILNSPRSQRQ